MSGLGLIAAGEQQTVDGLPAAISGAQQIAGGLVQALQGSKQVHTGIGQVKKGAVAPLSKQIKGSASTSLQQIAILTAGTDELATAPGGAGRTYVLTQSPNALKLASNIEPAGSSSSGTSRLIFGAGAGLMVLLVGIGVGIAVGRRRVA